MRTLRIAGLAALLLAAACGDPAAEPESTPVRVVRAVVAGAPGPGAATLAAHRRTASVSTPARPQ